MDNKFELNPEQKKLCHELTMEVIRQNNLFAKQCPVSETNFGTRVRNTYFEMYKEIAVGVFENWDSINGKLSK